MSYCYKNGKSYTKLLVDILKGKISKNNDKNFKPELINYGKCKFEIEANDVNRIKDCKNVTIQSFKNNKKIEFQNIKLEDKICNFIEFQKYKIEVPKALIKIDGYAYACSVNFNNVWIESKYDDYSDSTQLSLTINSSTKIDIKPYLSEEDER